MTKFVSKKSNVSAIQQDYLSSLSMKSTNAKISNNFKSITSTTESLQDTGATISSNISMLNNKPLEEFKKYESIKIKKLWKSVQ